VDPTIQSGESTTRRDRGLNEHDLFLLRMMLRVNASWVVTTHNAHVVKIEPVGKPLHAASIPGWWLRYAEANDLDLCL